MKFLKELLRNLGLIVLISGVAFLVYVVYTGIQTNMLLGIAAGTIVGGLILHIFINKKIG